jgi:hypothetical protein
VWSQSTPQSFPDKSPARSVERVQINTAGGFNLELKAPGRDVTPRLMVSHLEFMHRLAALTSRI